MIQIYKADILTPLSQSKAEFHKDAYLVVKDGIIKELSKENPSEKYPDSETIDLEGRLIIPGMIDTHLHLPQFRNIGKGNGLSLLEWLEKITFPEESKFSNKSYAGEVSEEFFQELIANGTTTASIYCSIHKDAVDIAFEIAKQKNIRAFIGKVMMDMDSDDGLLKKHSLLEDTNDSLSQSIELFKKWDKENNGLLRYIFTPRFALCCSEELMKQTGEFAKDNNAYIQSHLSENPRELEAIKKLFPAYKNYAEVYQKTGILGKRTIMAHCIYLSEEEIALINKTETKIAHCPNSNYNLQSGIMNYQKLKESGIEISLGTDISAGTSISMFDAMKNAIKASNDAKKEYEKKKIISPSKALYLATLAGAKALGIEETTGNLKKGKEADFIILKNKYNINENNLQGLMKISKNDIEGVYVRGIKIN